MREIPFESTIRWVPDFAVGVREIDDEHQMLFALTEKLHRAICTGHGRDFLEQVLDELVDYTCRHFAHEEALMERIQYPHYEHHRGQHRDLTSRVLAMREQTPMVAGNVAHIELMQFLLEWLKGHTTTSDRRIGSYMRKCGLVP